MTVTYSPYTSLSTALSTALNSLANGSRELSAAIVNTDLLPFMDIEVALATQGSARDTGGYVAVYMLASVDETNFTFGSDTIVPPPSSLLTTVTFDATTTARAVVVPRLWAAPVAFKLLFENQTGQALASSGNSLKYGLYGFTQA